jgi:hypothetical protein
MKRFFNTPVSFFVMAVLVAVLISAATSLVPKYGSDAEWYVAIANGHIGEVIKPFSGRFFQPLLAGQISSYLGLSINRSFLLLTIVSMALFLVVNAFLLKKTIKSSLLLVPIFLLPYFAVILKAFVLPDFFYIFLLSLFFLELFYKKESLSLLVLFLLFLTRESTIILGLIFFVVCLARSRKLLSAAALLVVLASIFITQKVGNLGLPDAYHLNGFSYLILKAPYDFLSNVFGVRLWTNALPNVCAPAFLFNLPQNLVLGSINKIGFCGFSALAPLQTIVALLTVFGAMPFVLFYTLFSNFKLILGKAPLWAVVSVIYGAIAFFTSVFVTNAIERSAGLGWPAFLLATPFLVGIFFQVDKRFLIKLSLVQFFVAWLPIVILGGSDGDIKSLLIVTLAVLLAYFYAFRVLKGQKMTVPQIEQFGLSGLI